VPKRQPIRAGAKEGDDIWVTGTIGDGVLGLLVSTGRLTLGAEAAAHLVGRYRLPEPRLAAGKGIAALAHASMDISDGLVGDLGHIAEESHLKAEIMAAAVPVSAAATEALAEAPELLSEMLSGGDDYEILFTASPRSAPAIARIARRAGTPITRIGRMKRGRGVTVLDRRGRPLDFERTGYRHF
ncbi:MAG: thiamine-phosphate kinase, partial [Alphaproteobacteria bacterium]|nr:thiamine-phosphate kinase [Alphaproteobacteria bacterium]